MRTILIAAAVLPALWLLIRVYRADRLEPEPPRLLLMLVLTGVLATALASLAERFGSWLLDTVWPGGPVSYTFVFCFLVVGLAEEGFKYLLLRWRTWRSPTFNCQFDGVVYAVFVSLGFALWENVGYVLRYGFGTALLRAVTAVPGHACFGVFMGVFYGLAKRYELAGDAARSRAARRAALLLPVLLHGCYDFIASLSRTVFSLVFIVFIAVLFIVALRLVRNASRNDRYFDGRGPWEV